MDNEQLNKMSRDYGALQEQLQAVAMQREQLAGQKEELGDAKMQIEKTAGKIYIALGGAIVETDKESASKDINEKIESAEMRLGIIKRQYDELSKKEQSLRLEITAALKGKGNQQ